MINLNTIQKFQLFCLEKYKAEKKISGKTALSEFIKLEVFDFLDSGYDVLHTQGKGYIVAEINEYIARRK